MRTRLALLVPLLAMLALGPATAPAQPPAPPAKAAGLDVVPTDSFAFLTVNVAKLWDNPNFKPLRDWAGTQKAGTLDRVFGVTPAEVERVTVFAPVADPDEDFAPLVLVTTRQPYNEAKVLKALAADRQNEVARKGRAIGFAEGRPFQWAVLVDDRTLLFGPKPALRGVAGAHLVANLMRPKKDGPFAQALADATKHDLALGVDVAGLGARLREEKLEKELVPYLALLKARTLTFAADFDKTARGYLRLSFADEAAAKRAAPVLKEALGDLATQFTKTIDARKDRLHPLEKLFFESAVTVLKGAKVESGENNVFASAEVPYQDTVAKFAAALPKSLEVAASETKAKNNLKQLSLAMLNFESAMGMLPSDLVTFGDKKLAMSWRVQILPYIEQDNLYKQLDHTKPWDDPANLKFLESVAMPKTFEIPGRPAPKGHTYFRVFSLPKGAKGADRPWMREGERGPRIADVTDGLSNTFMIVEAGEAVPWYKPDVLAYDGVLPLPQLGAKGAETFLVAFGDGSVKSLKRSKLDEKTLRSLITIQGGEVVTLP